MQYLFSEGSVDLILLRNRIIEKNLKIIFLIVSNYTVHDKNAALISKEPFHAIIFE